MRERLTLIVGVLVGALSASWLLPALDAQSTSITHFRRSGVFTGELRGADGTAGAPTYSFSADTDTGIYRIGADNVGFSAGGVLRWDYNTTRVKLSAGYTLDWDTTVIDATDIGKIDGIANGTGAANKALVLNADADITSGLRALSVIYSNLVTTSTSAVSVRNNQAATAGVPVQISPRLLWHGTAWDTDDLVSRSAHFIAEVLPASAASVTGTWRLGWLDPITSAITYPLTVTSVGRLDLTGGQFRVTTAATGTGVSAGGQARIVGTASGQAASLILGDGTNSNGWFGYQDSATAADRHFWWSANDGVSKQLQLNQSGLLNLLTADFGNSAEPACSSTIRGTVVLVEGGVGVADTFRVCTKDAADAYAYRALF